MRLNVVSYVNKPLCGDLEHQDKLVGGTVTKLTRLVASSAILGLVLAPFARLARAQQSQSLLTITTESTRAHVFPTVDTAGQLSPFLGDPGPLLYNGGPVMLPKVTTYAIFWVPPTLQNGNATSMPASYKTIQENLLTDYPGHSLDNNSTQYYQNISGKTYIKNAGGLGGFYVDNRAYPASGCTDPLTPGNCLSDAQIQHEVRHVMKLTGWTGGLNHIFLVFTSSGEGSCLDGVHCAYNYYCAYHGFISTASGPIIYTNQPFADLFHCQVGGVPSPNGNPQGDATTSIVSHEVTESITDPLLDAWFTAEGNEIGDLCAYNYGTLTWDGGNANEVWNGDPNLLQQEFDNHVGGCVQVGP